MVQPVIKTSFASGEWAPKLRSRVDIQKYHAGAAAMRNFFVDYSGGGASTRQGTQFIASVKTNGARLIPFQASATLSYVLEFGQGYIRFYSNGAQILSGGNPYEIGSPYHASDLFPNQSTGNPGLKFVQDANSLIICHPNYAPQILTLISATNWTLTAIAFGSSVVAPGAPTVTSSLAAGTYSYSYVVTALDTNNQESIASTPGGPAASSFVLISSVTTGQNHLSWTAVPGASSYNVYKASPSSGVAVPAGTPYGFIGNTTGTTFDDAAPGIAPDFSQTPPIAQSPFLGAPVTSINLTGNANYTAVPGITIAAPSVGAQATGSVTLGVSVEGLNAGGTLIGSTNPTGQFYTLPDGVTISITAAHSIGVNTWQVDNTVLTNPGSITGVGTATPTNPVTVTGVSGGFGMGPPTSFNLTWSVIALVLIQGGSGYTTAPAVTFSAGGATANTTIGTPAGGGSGLPANPGVVAFFQERLVFASPPSSVQSFYMSQPGNFFNFNISNPAQADDAITGTIVSEQLNEIRSLLPVPSGLMALTGEGAWLINGGGGISTASPITPSDAAANPQACNGANDLRPLKINFDYIFATNKGGYVRDQTYNVYANIFTGIDITTLSNHLFFNHTLVDWCWAEEPFKTIWAVRNDGLLLSCAFVKEQELIGWAHHDTDGQFRSVCSVIERVDSTMIDAVYVIVSRIVNNTSVQYVERFRDRYFLHGAEDAWSVDAALRTSPAQSFLTSTPEITGNWTAVGNSVTFNDTVNAPFVLGSVGSTIRSGGGVFLITGYTSASAVTVQVVRVPTTVFSNYNTTLTIQSGYTIWSPVNSVTGLTHLIGATVYGTADGVAIGPLTVSGGGGVTLPFTASKITLGLQFTPQLQTLPLDVGEPTVQSKRKKLPAVTLRVADTLGLQVGTSFSNLVTMKDFQLGAIPSQSNGPTTVTDLVNQGTLNQGRFSTGPTIDGRQILDQLWQEPGQLCIQQNLPYPATILAVIPEVQVGDTK